MALARSINYLKRTGKQETADTTRARAPEWDIHVRGTRANDAKINCAAEKRRLGGPR